MATLEQRIVSLAQAVGTDVKSLRNAIGVLSNLTSATKTDIVSAINETVGRVTTNSNSISTLNGQVAALQSGLGAIDLTQLINDLAGAGTLNKTYSVDKILTLITNVKADILGSAPEALDTLQELATALGNNPNMATDIAALIANRVRVDAVQTFTGTEQAQGRANINAASTTEVGTAQTTADSAVTSIGLLTTAVGNTDHDYTVEYIASKT